MKILINIIDLKVINSIALPPIIEHGSQFLKDLILRDVVTGKKHISLAISEPTAGNLFY